MLWQCAYLGHQILGVTCDNAANNDMMVDVIEEDIDAFNGKEARVRCFLHIMNIVAGKNLIRQFDTAAARAKDNNDEDKEEEKEIMALAHELDVASADDGVGDSQGDEGNDEDDSDDLDGEDLLDAVAELTEAERSEFEASSRPLKLLLAKVSDRFISIAAFPKAYHCFEQIRTFASKVVTSTTRLLPAWKECCRFHELPERLIPQDVRTRWNSTFDMLEVTLKYRAVYADMAASKENRLRQFELSDEDWDTALQLRKVLKVRVLEF